MKINPRCTHIENGKQCPDSAGYLTRTGANHFSRLGKCRKHAVAESVDPGTPARVDLRIAHLRSRSGL